MWLTVSVCMCLFQNKCMTQERSMNSFNLPPCHILSDFFSLTGDTYALPAGLNPLWFAHKALLESHRALHVIIVSLWL